jgi:ribosomal protein S18 acetylase RimI-like enzyme
MFTFRLAKETQIETLLWITYNQTTAYLQSTLDLIQITWEQFGHYFRSVGQVYAICENGDLVGYYWIEERGKILHLLGLILREGTRGKGIGTRVLEMLETTYRHRLQAIELVVHRSNHRAKALYERCGYQVVRESDESGFYIMQKPLSKKFEEEFINWLLGANSPTIRYLAMRHLLKLPEISPDLQAEWQALNTFGPVQSILSRQSSSGAWQGERSYYTPKYTSTHWSLTLLAELKVDPCDEGLQRGVQYMLDATRDELDRALNDGQNGLACFWGNLLRYALHARWEDDQDIANVLCYIIRQAQDVNWRCPYNNGLPCAWGIARSLWGLAALPENMLTLEIEAAICSALTFLLRNHSLVEAAYPDANHIHPLWKRMNFPLFYQADILFILRVLAELNRLDNPGAQPALTWLAERRKPNGRWRGANPFRRRTWPEMGDSEETNRWVSLQAALVLGLK